MFSLSAVTSQNNGIFNPKSKEYQAITFAAKGQLDKLREVFGETQNQLVKVSQNEDYYTPLHYAIANGQWQIVAFLLNQGVDWSVASKSAKGGGNTALSKLNNKEQGLCNLIEGLINLNEPIQVDNLVELLTSPSLSVHRRREMLENQNLRYKLSERLTKEEKLFVMASLMIGSYSWKGMQTDFLDCLTKGKNLPYSGTINCSQMILLASYLSGEKSLQEIDFEVQKGTSDILSKFTREDHQKMISPFTSLAEVDRIRLPINRLSAKNFGLTNEIEVQPQNIDALPSKIHTLFLIKPNDIVHHYALVYRLEQKTLMIHITEETGCVACEEAKEVLTEYVKKYPVTIYASMIPWHTTS